MYLYQTSNPEFVEESIAIAKKEFENLNLKDRIFKTLLNLGLLPGFVGFDILMRLIEKRVLNKNYKIVLKKEKVLAETINTAIYFAFKNSYLDSLFDNMFLCDAEPTIQEFVYKVATYIRNSKDFDIYFKVLPHQDYVIIGSEFNLNSCFTDMDIDTRISKFLHTLIVNNYSYNIEEVLGIWHTIVKEAYFGNFNNITASAEKMGLNPLFLQRRLNRSIKHMHCHCTRFTQILFVEKYPPSILQVVILISAFLRQNKDIELFYSAHN